METTPARKLVGVRELSLQLGISVRQIRKFVSEGSIPYVRFDRRLYFEPDRVEEWIAANRYGANRPEAG